MTVMTFRQMMVKAYCPAVNMMIRMLYGDSHNPMEIISNVMYYMYSSMHTMNVLVYFVLG